MCDGVKRRFLSACLYAWRERRYHAGCGGGIFAGNGPSLRRGPLGSRLFRPVVKAKNQPAKSRHAQGFLEDGKQQPHHYSAARNPAAPHVTRCKVSSSQNEVVRALALGIHIPPKACELQPMEASARLPQSHISRKHHPLPTFGGPDRTHAPKTPLPLPESFPPFLSHPPTTTSRQPPPKWYVPANFLLKSLPSLLDYEREKREEFARCEFLVPSREVAMFGVRGGKEGGRAW